MIEWNPIRDHNLQALIVEIAEEVNRRKRGEEKRVGRVGQLLREQKEKNPQAYERRLAYTREYKRRTGGKSNV